MLDVTNYVVNCIVTYEYHICIIIGRIFFESYNYSNLLADFCGVGTVTTSLDIAATGLGSIKAEKIMKSQPVSYVLIY